MAFDPTVGGESANSYVTLSYAESYFEGSPKNSQWSAVLDQEAVLMYATTLLDSLVSWVGVRSTTTQALDWPRTLDYDLYDNVIPVDVQRATCELALYVNDGSIPVTDNSLDNVKVGPIRVDFNEDIDNLLLPPLVSGMISQFGTVTPYPGSGITTSTLLRT